MAELREMLEEVARRRAKESAIEALKRRAMHARNLAAVLEKHAADIENPPAVKTNLEVSAADRFGWAINEIENFLRNLNFAEMARRMAELSV